MHFEDWIKQAQCMPGTAKRACRLTCTQPSCIEHECQTAPGTAHHCHPEKTEHRKTCRSLKHTEACTWASHTVPLHVLTCSIALAQVQAGLSRCCHHLQSLIHATWLLQPFGLTKYAWAIMMSMHKRPPQPDSIPYLHQMMLVSDPGYRPALQHRHSY